MIYLHTHLNYSCELFHMRFLYTPAQPPTLLIRLPPFYHHSSLVWKSTHICIRLVFLKRETSYSFCVQFFTECSVFPFCQKGWDDGHLPLFLTAPVSKCQPVTFDFNQSICQWKSFKASSSFPARWYCQYFVLLQWDFKGSCLFELHPVKSQC